MKSIEARWLRDFDHYMINFYAIDHVDAGMNPVDLRRYSDLDPREAALVYGQDYDLCRVDSIWGQGPRAFSRTALGPAGKLDRSGLRLPKRNPGPPK